MLKINNSNPKLLNFIFRKVHNFFFLIFSYFILFLDEFVPKKKNLIAFAQKNKLFSDNSKAFFQNASCQTGGEAFLQVFLVLFTKESQIVAYKSLLFKIYLLKNYYYFQSQK